jgi:hypothetical protein
VPAEIIAEACWRQCCKISRFGSVEVSGVSLKIFSRDGLSEKKSLVKERRYL